MIRKTEPIVEQTLYLAGPKEYNMFSDDPIEKGFIHRHFRQIIEHSRERCQWLGLTVDEKRSEKGEMIVSGPKKKIDALIAYMQKERFLLS